MTVSWYSITASCYSTNSFLMLLRDCFFAFPRTFVVHNSFLVFHKSCLIFHTCCLVFLGASRYYTKASRYSSNQYSLRVRSSLRWQQMWHCHITPALVRLCAYTKSTEELRRASKSGWGWRLRLCALWFSQCRTATMPHCHSTALPQCH